ncbi:MAG: type II TA system antitoxin MqsA family protein, partial [Cetobacterium sp.]
MLKYCELCDEHHLEVRKKVVTTDFRNTKIEYESEAGFCPNLEEEILIDDMLDKNLKNMREAYRSKVNLLTSDEIKNIRDKIGVSQKNLGIILGMGEATIGRIESKIIQDRSTDDAIKRLIEDPTYLLERLELVKDKIGPKVYSKIINNIDENEEISIYNYKILKIKYSKYKLKSKLNGLKELNLEKVENMIIYFINNCEHVFKTKLNKLMWYADFESFKCNQVGITGLTYIHKPYGAVPEGIDEILKISKKINITEEINEDFGSVYFKISALENFNEDLFSDKELIILNKVVNKFKNFKNREISNYMHEEEAYKHTKENSIIDYNFA